MDSAVRRMRRRLRDEGDAGLVDTPPAPLAGTLPGVAQGWAAGLFVFRHAGHTGSAILADAPHSVIDLLPAASHRREPWKNGVGWTHEVLRHPATGDWDWRVSVAEVCSDGPFSTFPGCEREIVLVSGLGMDLHFDDGGTHRLEPPHGRLRFSGERPVSARLVEGPTTDFNLIWKRDTVDAQLLHRPIVGPMLFFGESGVTWLLHVLAGQVCTSAGRLEAGDAARMAIGPGERQALDGGGELLIAKLRSRPPS